jgi:Tfp pilus assembly protein FimT
MNFTLRFANHPRRGFTVAELLLLVVVVGLLAVVAGPRTVAVLQRAGLQQAASVVANDLEQAVSLAARQRRPVRIACDCVAGTYTLVDRTTGAVLFRRDIVGTSAGYGVGALAFSPAQVEVFPSGVTTGALTVTLSSSGGSRRVIMSAGGLVRVLR